MRILVLAGDLDRPEVAIFQGLAQKGAQIHVVGALSETPQKNLVRSGISVTQFAFRSRFDIAGMRLIRRLIAREGCDVIYAVSNRALSTCVLGTLGLKVPIAAYRGTVGHISWFDPSSWFTYLNSKVSSIVCVSSAVEEYLAGVGIPRARLITIYKGHDPEWYRSQPIPRASIGVPDEAFVVGCTAVMRAVKGIDDLLEAVALLVPEIPSLHVVLVGSIKDPDIQRRVDAFPYPQRLHLTGYRDDATAFATLYDVVVLASKSREGFPKSVIEAMAQGVPAVLTAVGGMPELVNHGTAGLLVEPSNPAMLAEAIRTLYADPQLRRTMGEKARDLIRSTFHVSTTVERMFKEFSRLAARP